MRLANPGTDSPVEIERATVFNLSNDAAPVAFNASPIHIPGRGTVESNPVEINVKPGDVLRIAFGQRTLAVEVLAVADAVRKDDAAAMYRELPE
ncbi:MAG: RNA-binding S4 domain-containing protein [Lachnospiraceae bacterium]|nr:RNA-binding S4 domain-containing protein [Lachnospiraceae bacterium]